MRWQVLQYLIHDGPREADRVKLLQGGWHVVPLHHQVMGPAVLVRRQLEALLAGWQAVLDSLHCRRYSAVAGIAIGIASAATIAVGSLQQQGLCQGGAAGAARAVCGCSAQGWLELCF